MTHTNNTNAFSTSQRSFSTQSAQTLNSQASQSSENTNQNLTGFGQPLKTFDANSSQTGSAPDMTQLLVTFITAMMGMIMQLITTLLTTLTEESENNQSENNTSESTATPKSTDTKAETSSSATEINNTGGADNVSRETIQPTSQSSTTAGGTKALVKAESLIGKNENTDTEELQGILQGVNPADTPWCAYFVSAMLDEDGGAPWKADLGHAGYVPTIRSWAQEKGVYHQPGGDYQPKPGDVVIEGDADHIELVKDVIIEDGKVVGVITIGGNTSDSVKQSERRFDAGYVTGIVQV